MLGRYSLPRDLHPGAWWAWALALAAAASRTLDPLLLAMIIAVACCVVVARRSDAPWAMSFRLYLWLGLLVVVVRVGFRIIFGGDEGGTIVLTLPQIPLPSWAAGISLFGPISYESLRQGFCDGLRLAAMIICLGAANALANPKRLLKALPSALYEVGAAVVVAMSIFPQLAESIVRVRRARRLRGDAGKGARALRSLVIPVLEDALERSMRLAASMDSRGYGRSGDLDRRTRLVTGALLVVGLMGLCVGIYATVNTSMPPTPDYLARPMLAGGILLAGIGFVVSGRRVQRTRYRPDTWRAAELVTAACGVVAARGLYSDPRLTTLTVVAIAVAALPAWLTPAPADATGYVVASDVPELVS